METDSQYLKSLYKLIIVHTTWHYRTVAVQTNFITT